MKQAIIYGAADLRLEESPLDPTRLADDQVYTETEVTAISTGTELAIYEGRLNEIPTTPDYPRPLGYSNVGRVVRTGSAVRGVKAGQRVFSRTPHQSAYIAQQDELMVPVPEGVGSEEASLAYLAQLGMTALRQAGYQTGEHVAVIGLGVIGLAAVAVARAMGARVAAISNSPLRFIPARRMGAHGVFLSSEVHTAGDLGNIFGETGTDVVLLTANTWEAFRTSVEIARFGGRISVLGFPGRAQPKPEFNPLDPQWFYGKQLTLAGVGYSPRANCQPWEIRFTLHRNLEYVFALMVSGTLKLESLITHRFPPTRMREAYELVCQHSKELIAAIFDWRSPCQPSEETPPGHQGVGG
jgi:threonine dehydrogenase-like Zn-dependent dehydrogenase